MISDFAVFLTIAIMVLLDYAVGVPSQKLKVPNKFKVYMFYYHNVDLDIKHNIAMVESWTHSSLM